MDIAYRPGQGGFLSIAAAVYKAADAAYSLPQKNTGGYQIGTEAIVEGSEFAVYPGTQNGAQDGAVDCQPLTADELVQVLVVVTPAVDDVQQTGEYYSGGYADNYQAQ